MSEKLYTAADLAYYYELGVQHERERAATADYEAELFWSRSIEQIHRDRHLELTLLFTDRARIVAAEMGRAYQSYRGGPVVWS